MPRFIPLICALAPFVIAGCDQQPAEPLPVEARGPQALMDSKPAEVIEFDFSTSWDMCGYATVDCDLRFFLVSRDWYEDAAGGTHFSGNVRYHGICTSPATGETWIWNGGNARQVQFNASGQETESRIQGTYWIGLGAAPNFMSEIKAHYTVDANGREVTYHSVHLDCAEPGS